MKVLPDKHTMVADEEICRRLSAGEWEAMELIFHKYYKRLVVWADTFLEDLPMAEDVVQELFMRLWEKKRGMTLEGGSLSAFLHVAVRNRCYHRLEKRDVLRHTVDLREVDTAFEEYNEKHDQIITKILNEIDSLPPRSREVMSAVFVEGLKYREVAEKYSISLSTVKTLLGNAVRKLREQLNMDEFSVFLFFFKIRK